MTATAPAPAQVATGNHHGGHLWAIAAGAVVLAIIGLLTFGARKSDQVAQQKAQELTQRFVAAGLPVPADQEVITRQLGDDGGYVCSDPASALGRGILYDQLANGAAFAGHRPVIADPQVIKGELLIIQTYCPDKLQQFRERFGNLKLDTTVKR